MRIEDLPTEISEGKLKLKFEVNTTEIEIELAPEITDINKLRYIQTKVEKKDVEERDILEQSDILKTILKKSYPTKNDAWLDNIMIRYGEQILIELYFELGWRNRQEFERLKAAKEKALNKTFEIIEKKITEQGKPEKEPEQKQN